MAITSLDGLIAANTQRLTYLKTASRTTQAALPFSIFDLAGNPAAGTLAMSNTVLGNSLLLSKQSVSINNKALNTSVGYSSAVNKTNHLLINNTFNISIGYGGVLPLSDNYLGTSTLDLSVGYTSEVSVENFVLLGKNLRLLTVDVIYPVEQLHFLSTRNTQFILNNPQKFYTLTEH